MTTVPGHARPTRRRGRRLAAVLVAAALGAGALAPPVGAQSLPAPDQHTFTALPYLRPVATTWAGSFRYQDDLRVRGIELTQAVQCFDATAGITGCADNEVRLVTGKASAARIYLATRFLRREHVPVRLYYRLRGQSDFQSVLLTGAATQQLDQGSALSSVNVYFTQVGSAAVGEFYAVVDPDDVVDELDETNNRFPASGYSTVSFAPRRSLDVLGQRLDHHPSGYTGTRVPSGWAVDGGAARYWERTLPVPDGGVRYRRSSGTLDWQRTLQGNPDNQHRLIQTLNLRWALGQLPWFSGAVGEYRGARHVYGWAPNDGYRGGHADMPVYPHAGGYGVVGIGTDRPGTSTDDPGGGALIMAHELVHDYDVLHTDTADACGSEDDGSTWPYSSSSIQEYGFNPATGVVYDPDDTHDVMSYCPASGSTRGWVSPFTWHAMYDALAPGASAAAASDAHDHDAHQHDASQVDEGSPRTPTDEVTIRPVPKGEEQVRQLLTVDVVLRTAAEKGVFARLGEAWVTPGEPVEAGLDPEGPYLLRLRDAEGGVVGEHRFSTDFASEYSGHHGEGPGKDFAGPNSEAHAYLTVPFDGARTVEVVVDEQVQDRRVLSAHAPQVSSVVADTAQRPWTPGSSHVVSWTGADDDGDALTYWLLASRDGGSSWAPLAGPTQETKAELTTDHLAGGETLFRVVASDGLRSSDAVADLPVLLPDQAPSATITEPGPGRTLSVGSLLVLEGSGNDLEDGMLEGASLAWTVDGAPVGEGSSVQLDDLAPGRHEVVLTATDSGGRTARDTTEVLVTEVVAPTPAPAVEGSPVRAAASFTAPDGAAATLTCSVQYGDGSAPVAGTVSGDSCVGPEHRYRDDGTYTVATTVLAGEQPLGTATAEQVVTNAAPQLHDVAPAAPVVEVGAPLELSATLTDAGLDDTHVGTVDWGDGIVTPAQVTGGSPSTLSASHAYVYAGLRTVTVTATDDDGGQATRQLEVVVIDRGPSWLTGGARWVGPDGVEQLTSEVRWAKDRTAQGETRYASGPHVLQATRHDWLAVDGSRAATGGTGTWDGVPGHRFLVVVDDRGPTSDRVRVRVTAPDGTVVADTQPGAPAAASPATSTVGGNLTVHQR